MRLVLLFCLMWSAVASAEELNQFALISQSDWAGKKGVFLVLDNRYAGAPSKLDTLRVTFAVGDGKAWQIRSVPGEFEFGRQYAIKVSVDGQTATLWIDGAQREQFATGFVPAKGSMFGFGNHEWAHRPADYLITEQSLSITTPAGARQFLAAGTADPRQYVFNPGSAQTHAITLATPFTIEASFAVSAYPELKQLSPLVDKYGQVNFANWEGKVSSDEQLKEAMAEEELKLAEWEKQLPQQDKFGGRTDLGWKENATGFFRVTKRHGKWWMISPEGNPCFFTGICNAPALDWEATPVSGREFLFEWLPPAEGAYKSAWSADHWDDSKTRYVAPQASNLIIQHGDAWRAKETQRAIRRMRAWGFSGMGKWTTLPQQTRLPVLNRSGVPDLVRHPDTFDAEVRSIFHEALSKQVANLVKDPFVIGFSLGNEMDESFTSDEVIAILGKEDGSSAAKRAMVDFAIGKLFEGDAKQLAAAWKARGESAADFYNVRLMPRPNDLEALRMLLAQDYFGFVYRTMKELAPNHLYFGHWILPTYWNNENDWRHVAPYCDVIGFDLYEEEFGQEKLQKVIRESNKPVFCGEFSFPPYWNGERGYGRFRTAVRDEEESGAKYAAWVKAAAENPWCVGVSVFQYRDQPVTGRGPVASAPPAAVHGENYAFGMVDVTNRPRWKLLEQVRQANLNAAQWRNKPR